MSYNDRFKKSKKGRDSVKIHSMATIDRCVDRTYKNIFADIRHPFSKLQYWKNCYGFFVFPWNKRVFYSQSQ